MITFLPIPIGAVLILLLHLLRMPKRWFLGVFYGALTFAFVTNVAEWGSGVREIGQIFRIDDFTRFFALLFIFVIFLAALSLNSQVPTHRSTAEDNAIILSLLLLASFAMTLVASSTSVISLFLSMEFLAIAFYELVALKKDIIGMEAAIKFFVVGVFSSLLFLLGAGFYYGALGTTDFSALAGASYTPFLVSSLVLMLAGIGFKMSLFPLNLWLPDVYEGAPSPITAILAGAAKKAGFAAYMRFLTPLMLPALRFKYFSLESMASTSWHTLIALIAASTMLFGAIAAVLQQNVKRLIAYSIISHAGFIAIGLAAGTRLGYTAAFLHICIHALMALGTFLMISILEEKGLRTLDDYNGLAKRNSLFAFTFTLFLASLTGIPPLAGFFSKFLLWTSAVNAGMTWLVVVAVTTSLISSYFYFIVLRRIYGYEASEKALSLQLTTPQIVSIALPAVLIVLFGLFPNRLLNLISTLL
ncbi:MAG: NADH-quinone oxidoreductase subunit N [bacterium]|nr:NADH-quinone oxidoreductase subunit N [bacterium]